MHLREGEFSQSHTDFFEAFKNYDESGSPRLVKQIVLDGYYKFSYNYCIHSILFRRLACLKYLVLANMLMKSAINPFDSQEVRYN